MAERKRTTEEEIREVFPNAEIVPQPLSVAEIRAIVREEITKLWQHDADHGSIQSRREAQRERDRAAGLAAE